MVFRHLAREDAVGRLGDDSIWQAVVGPAAALAASAGVGADAEVASMPAVVFAEQSKAFERIGFEWILRVLEGWRAPG